MTRVKKILITCTCLFLLLIIGGVMYANYYITHILLAQNPQHDIASQNSDVNDNKQSDTIVKNATAEENAVKPTGSEKKDVQTDGAKQPIDKTATEHNDQSLTNSDKKPGNTPTANMALANTAQQEIGKPLETTDLFQAGIIILSKLGKDEIDYLTGFSDRTYTNEELKKVRNLLLSKLNDSDIRTLKALGRKYGKKLDILDPTVPIK